MHAGVRRRVGIGAIAAALFLAVASAALFAMWDGGSGEEPFPGTGDQAFPPGTFTSAPGPEEICAEYWWQPTREGGPDPFAESHRCLLYALAAGTPAVLVRHITTNEGDPVREQLRVMGPDSVEFTVDATLDNFGSGTVETYACRGLMLTAQWLLGATECPDSPEQL